MSDVALKEGSAIGAASASRSAVLRRLRAGDAAFRTLTRSAAIAVLLLLSGTLFSLVHGSLPAFGAFGLGFVWSEQWNPVTEQFGALAPIYGTLVTSFIAMIIAVPIGLMIAFFLTELCPKMLRRPIAIAIELLAAAQGIDFLRPLTSSGPVEALHARLREHCASMPADHYLAPDIERATALVQAGALRAPGAPRF